MKNLGNLIVTITLILITNLNTFAQNEEGQSSVEFSIGAAYTIAPSFEVAGIWTGTTKSSANFYSLFADLKINQKLLGRVQVSKLAISSLSEDVTSDLESGFQMNGSLGYNHKFESNPKIEIPIMATLGFSTVTDGNSRDAGMQVGATTGLNYALSQRITASSTLRYLRGLRFSDGSKMNQIDFSVGILFKLL